ncbi:MAG: ergothioneine biosynthesis protein EgtB [Gammaproteobacteria bacterium PRO9]|nr:ergothioneine biosynthesis protein EgtB [Gammaproteobacteria bacterium PRO9]
MASIPQSVPSAATQEISGRYRAVRTTTGDLVATLQPEDFVVQSMPHASPAKWHLAHVTWFFEQFVLKPHVAGYREFAPLYGYLFNSYYQSVGTMHARAARGMLTRPTTAEIQDYRRHVDQAMEALLADPARDPAIDPIVAVGLNHEQQHQELLLTDLKHAFSLNPLEPAWRPGPAALERLAVPLRFLDQPGGIVQIGAADDGFSFDNERPRHRIFLESHALANRLATNAEYREFILAGGYRQSSLWLADGWQWRLENAVERPLYWDESCETVFGLGGRQPIDWQAPVCHVSYYEADAFARWAGMRLPAEAEWESAAAGLPVAGNLQASGRWRPEAAPAATDGFLQLYGDVWEWTASAYGPYPGFQPLGGSLGEYNGKFMCNQMVCRGGSCLTPADHVRASYRNFFYPGERWQFFGLRLARNA